MARDIQIYLNNFFERHDFRAKKIGVALSGGRDSVALAYALKKGGFDIVAINVEHGIRGENSLKDSAFVKDFCGKYGIELYASSVDAPSYCREKGYTIEQGARELRYAVFQKAIDDGVCDVIALAHHLDDQAETIFMRIIRGTGVAGLKGMQEVRDCFIRPLLDCPREDIEAYIEDNNLEYVDDESNFDTDYTRNYLRKELEVLKEKFPQISRSFARLSQNAKEEEGFVQRNLPSFELVGDEARVLISDMQDDFVAKRIVLNAINALGVTQDIESRHYPLVFALKYAQNGKKINLTHDICVHKDGEFLVFSRQKNDENPCEIPFEIGKNNCFGVRVEEVDYDEYLNAAKGEILFCDMNKIPSGAVLRNRRDGDFINKFGGGRKSLGDFLTDKKVPLRKRDELVLIASGKEVYAIFGVEISRKVAIEDSSARIVKLVLE